LAVAWSEEALDQLSEALSGFGETGAEVQMLIQWGPMIKDDRQEWMPAYRQIPIDQEEMTMVAANWRAGKVEEASMLLAQAFLNRYPLPGAKPRDIDVFELRLCPTPM
jgi:hypothetical protein